MEDDFHKYGPAETDRCDAVPRREDPEKFLTEDEAMDMVRSATFTTEGSYLLTRKDVNYIIKRIYNGI